MHTNSAWTHLLAGVLSISLRVKYNWISWILLSPTWKLLDFDRIFHILPAFVDLKSNWGIFEIFGHSIYTERIWNLQNPSFLLRLYSQSGNISNLHLNLPNIFRISLDWKLRNFAFPYQYKLNSSSNLLQLASVQHIKPCEKRYVGEGYSLFPWRHIDNDKKRNHKWWQ